MKSHFPRRWMSEESKVLRPRPLLLAGLGLLITVRVVLALFDLGVLHRDTGCSPQESSHSPAEDWLFDRAMSLSLPTGQAEHVALVTLTEGSEPLDVINNTCDNRRFMTGLVHELDGLGAKAIAIDQSYSDGSCTLTDVNDAFRTNLEGAKTPVIVGERLHARTDAVEDGDCLVENPTFNFKAANSVRDNVKFGLLRLNDTLRKIPLTWWVFPSDRATTNTKYAPAPKEGLALVAATQADSSIRNSQRLQDFIAGNEHPYTSFVSSIPAWSAMDLMCYGPDKIAASHPEWGNCENIAHVPFEFAGKVLVVGDHIDSDRKSLGSASPYGMDLHAQYIESLLDGRYIGAAPAWLDDGAIVLFAIAAIILEAMSVRRVMDKEVITHSRIALILLLVVAALIIGFLFALTVLHLFMQDFLIASLTMGSLFLGYLFLGVMAYLSERFPVSGEKEAK